MKIVLFTQRVEIIESYGERRDCADQRISQFIFECGYIPIPVPNNDTMIEKIVKELRPQGIVLTGGNSLVKYGGNAPERDATDRKLIELAIDNLIPVYGFCRGMQSILDYFNENLTNVEGHVAKRHETKGNISGSFNSYHNQACIKLKNDSELGIDAICDDGVIEAVYHKQYPIIGNMWHPEREDTFNVIDIERIQKLFG